MEPSITPDGNLMEFASRLLRCLMERASRFFRIFSRGALSAPDKANDRCRSTRREKATVLRMKRSNDDTRGRKRPDHSCGVLLAGSKATEMLDDEHVEAALLRVVEQASEPRPTERRCRPFIRDLTDENHVPPARHRRSEAAMAVGKLASVAA
jgi:hypothetical protein